MSQEFYDLPDEAATLSLGAELGHRLAAGGCVYLEGDLGAGKTTLVRGMLRRTLLWNPTRLLASISITLTCIVWRIRKNWN